MKNQFTAIVTGASKGIGRAIALELSMQQNCTVLVNYAHNATAAEGVVKEIIKNGGSAIAVKTDVGKEMEVHNLFNRAEEIAPVKILVNNAGVALYKKNI
jgi:3-oxoacyl-[acyl-carrier protein] reductase